MSRPKTHGHASPITSEYRAWQAMKTRCYIKSYRNFHKYGGAGIVVCSRWVDSFENFLSDMGLKPSSKHSLDRRDSKLDYTPDNCRWATLEQQSGNRSCNHFITHKGKTMIVADWAREIGVKPNTLRERIRRGIPIARALS